MATTPPRPYPIPDSEPRYNGYEVSVNGVPAPVLPVRVSKYPFNRRWPGHERDICQTEIAGMVLLATSGETTLDITPNHDFNEAIVRPLSRKARVVRSEWRLSVTIPGPGQYTLELDDRHCNLHIFADPPTDFGVAPGPGVHYFGPGVHDAGLITLSSGETLYIDEGAVVHGRVEARDADGIRILGNGILDCSRVLPIPLRNDPAKDAEDLAKGFEVANVFRPDAILLEFCDDVLIDGPTIRDSQQYTIRPVGCRDLTIRNVKIVGNWRYNSDGIDMHNCRRVRISDCFIRAFDDCLCIKGFDAWMNEADMLHDGEMHDLFEDVVVERCITWADWGRNFEIGAETRAREIRDVIFRDCDAIYATHICCDVQNVDYADVHGITFEDIRCEYRERQPEFRTQRTDADLYDGDESGFHPALVLTSNVTYIPEYSAGGQRRGVNRDIVFRDIRVFAPEMPPSRFAGYSEEGRVRDVTIDGLFLNGRRIASADEARITVAAFADPPRFL